MSSHTLQLITSQRAASFPAADRVDVSVGRLSVRTRRLSGGLREGVLLVELVAGDTKVFVLPDRGLGIWKIVAGGVELGWQSPVHGPVHPRFVPLAEPSGLGWLDGFDELVARCGLVSNGAPDFDASGRLRHGASRADRQSPGPPPRRHARRGRRHDHPDRRRGRDAVPRSTRCG